MIVRKAGLPSEQCGLYDYMLLHEMQLFQQKLHFSSACTSVKLSDLYLIIESNRMYLIIELICDRHKLMHIIRISEFKSRCAFSGSMLFHARNSQVTDLG